MSKPEGGQLFLDGRVTLHRGDCLDVLKAMPDNSIDSCVTDPPYALTQNKKGGSGVASLNVNSPAGRTACWRRSACTP